MPFSTPVVAECRIATARRADGTGTGGKTVESNSLESSSMLALPLPASQSARGRQNRGSIIVHPGPAKFFSPL